MDPDKTDATHPAAQEDLSAERLAPERSWILRRLDSIAVAVFLLCLVSLLVTLTARSFWLGEMFASLRIQQLVGLGIVVTTFLLLGRFRFAAGGTLMIVFHACWMYHAVPDAQAVPLNRQSATDGSRSLSVMTMNVLTRNKQHDLILDAVRDADPDVFAVLELSDSLSRRLEEQLPDYPHKIERPSDAGNFGIGVYSKIEFQEHEVFRFNSEIESVRVVVAMPDQPDRLVGIFATHPLPPMGGRLYQKRNEHLSKLVDRIVADRLSQPDVVPLLLGDLNLTPWSPIFGDFCERADFVRAIDSVDMTPTWYRGRTFLMGLCIDHVLIDPRLSCTEHRVGPNIGSDHRSVYTTLVWDD